MNKAFFTMILIISSSMVDAKPNTNTSLKPLTLSDLQMLNSGAACWLEDKETNPLLQDDMSAAVINLSDKTIKLKRGEGDWDKGIFSCGGVFNYNSAADGISVKITMGPLQDGQCHGNLDMTVNSESLLIESLRSKCGD